MERRTFLRWAVHGLGAVFGAVLGVPAVVYLIDPRNRPVPERNLRPIARYKELQLLPEVPKEVVVRETRHDAWTLHPNEIVGRVWLVLRGDPAARPPRIDAYTTTCPHLGCSINYTGNDFLCPCHGAHFTITGTAIRRDDQGNEIDNRAPRDMDSLELRVERIPNTPDADPDYVILVKYQKFKSNVPEKEPIA